QARAKFHRLMATRLASDPGVQPDTIKGAAAIWITLNQNPSNRQWLPRFVEFAGGEYLADISRDLLIRYHVHLKQANGKRAAYDKATKTWHAEQTDKPLSAETIKHYVRTATAVLKWAHDQGYMKIMPNTPKLTMASRPPRDVEPGRLAAILDALPKRASGILKFLAYTGARPGEVCRLEWKHVHLDAGLCILPDHKTAGKTGKPRTIYLTDQAADILRTMKPTIGPVFTSRFGKPYTPAGLRAILKRHGGIVPYSLRHSFAQTASEQIDADDLSKILGHTDGRMTRRYYDVRDKRALSAIRTIKLPLSRAKSG
ncbi:MAG: tyrosine-type recombinase/integrase, partial [Planctomycetota bacterium]